MPLFRRGIRSPIKTDKHEVTWSNLAQDASSTQAITLSTSVASADKDTSTEVEVGSHIKWIYFEFHFSANVITNPKVIHWTIEVLPPSMPASTPSVYYDDSRAYIIKRGMEMLPKDTGTVFKRIFVVKIPRGYQRQTKAQVIQFRYVASSAEAINACGIVIYKEIY